MLNSLRPLGDLALIKLQSNKAKNESNKVKKPNYKLQFNKARNEFDDGEATIMLRCLYRVERCLCIQ